jgi:hypothetical protein
VQEFTAQAWPALLIPDCGVERVSSEQIYQPLISRMGTDETSQHPGYPRNLRFIPFTLMRWPIQPLAARPAE